MPEPRLTPLPGGKLKLGAEHFRRVVRRIECIKPLAGDGISIRETEDGIEISASNSEFPTASNTGSVNLIVLDVCRNGEPAQITVYGFEGYVE
jgi:hypothetical protein